MKKIIFILFIWAAASLPRGVQAQIFTVLPGTDVLVKPGTMVFADSLILTPSVNFIMTNTTLSRHTTANHTPSNPYIARVYRFSNTSKAFSGAIQVNYRDGSELKGIPESGLTFSNYNGAGWASYPAASRDALRNYVLTNNLKSVCLNELTLTQCPRPVIRCNADTFLNTAPGRCGAIVGYKAPVVTDLCGTASLVQIAGLPSGSLFPVGITKNTFVATSTSGKKDTCWFTVTIKDNEPPLITQVNASPSSLWPPNHAMKNVTVNYNTWDNCGTVASSLTVSSNEPVTGSSGGDLSPDWLVTDNHHVLLRAERSGAGNGRVYTITITGSDAYGNTVKKITTVNVPHNQSNVHARGLQNGVIDANGDYTGQFFDYSVTPNPGTQYFNLRVTSASYEKIEVKLLDISGRVLSYINVMKDQTTRFGNELQPGVYFLEIKQGNQSKTAKLIKQ